MASTSASPNFGNDVSEPPNEENSLNISLESDHLDPEQKAAHEADTLPMDGAQAPQPKPQTKWSAIAGRGKDLLSPILVKVGLSILLFYSA